MIGRAPVNIKPTQESVENNNSNITLSSRINELLAKSHYSYLGERGVDCVIKNRDGEEFEIKKIENNNDPKLKDIISLLKETFSKEEIDSDEVFMAAVDGKSPWGTSRDKYRVVSIYDENKELSAACIGSVLNIKNLDKVSANEMIFFVEYMATNQNLKKSGLAREAYISSLMDAAKIAKENNKNLNFSAGECTSSSEHFWNSMGEKRMYIKLNNEYKELSYISPGVNFDKENGIVALNDIKTPLHLMTCFFGDEKISKEKIKDIYGIIVSSEMWPKEAFSNDEAYEKYSQYMQNLKNKFIESLESQGDLVLLSAEEREDVQKEGFVVSENK